MRLLFKKLFRDIREAGGQFASILLVILIGVMFYVGLNSALRNLEFASEKYYEEYRLADLWVNFQKAPEQVLDRIRLLPEVNKVTGRVTQDVRLTHKERNLMIRLITLSDRRRETVNDVMIKSGRYFSGGESNQCLVEESFFKAQGLKFGDQLRPVINGNQVKLKVIGTVKSPEFVYPLQDGSELIPNPERFGVVYLQQSYGQTIFGFDGSINEAAVILTPGADIERVKAKLERLLNRYGLIEVILRKDQLSYSTFSTEIEQLKSASGLFPIIFLLVAAVIIYITMSRMIENQRIQIGTLKALGYSNLAILFHYLSYGILIGIAGSGLGAAAGMYLGESIIAIYNNVYQLPLERIKPQYDLIIPATALTLFFCLLAGYNSSKNELQLAPAESMRPKAPKAGYKTLVEKIGSLWQRLNFSWKIILRNLFRYKKRALLTSIGIVFATALLLAALGMMDSTNYLIDQQYSNIQLYDLKVSFNQFLHPSEISYFHNLAHVTKVEPMLEIGMELRNGWRAKKIGLTGLIANSSLYRITDRDGRIIEVPEDGILISDQLGRLFELAAGDFVLLKHLLPVKKERGEKSVRVEKTVAQYIGQSVYSRMDQAYKLLEEGPLINVVLLKLADLRHEKEVIAKIKEIAVVGSYQSKADSLRNLQKALGNMYSMIGIIILAAGALTFAVVYNITAINIFERRRELATLRVLGFTDGEMQQLVFNENFIVALLAIGAGLPIGRGLCELIMLSTTTDNMSFPAILETRSYLITVVLTLLFTILANVILIKKVKTINMVEALKSSE